MNNRVLVAYATKHGATVGIAEKIGQTLQEAGLAVDVMEVREVGDLASYAAVVLGSAVYIGRWRKEAAKFLKANEEALAAREVWLFSSGPTEEGDPEELVEGWGFPSNLEAVADRIQPHDIAIFHGAMDPETLNAIERFMINRVGAPTGDFRDWEMIDSWAQGIAATLAEEEVA